MITRRRLLLFGMLAIATVFAVAVWMLWPRPGITRANAMRIEVGMTRADVEAVLGGPARDESVGPTKIDGEVPKSLEPDEFGGFDQDIEFRDKEGRVVFSRAPRGLSVSKPTCSRTAIATSRCWRLLGGRGCFAPSTSRPGI